MGKQAPLTDQCQIDTFRRVTDQSVRDGFARLTGTLRPAPPGQKEDRAFVERCRRVVSLTARAVSLITRKRRPANRENPRRRDVETI